MPHRGGRLSESERARERERASERERAKGLGALENASPLQMVF